MRRGDVPGRKKSAANSRGGGPCWRLPADSPERRSGNQNIETRGVNPLKGKVLSGEVVVMSGDARAGTKLRTDGCLSDGEDGAGTADCCSN